MKLCVDCCHFKAAADAEYDKCMREATMGTDPVRGGPVQIGHHYCDMERKSTTGCGPDAIHFLARDKAAA